MSGPRRGHGCGPYPQTHCRLGVLGTEAPRTGIGNGEQGTWVWESLRLVLWAIGTECLRFLLPTSEARAAEPGAWGQQLPLPLHPGRDPSGEPSLVWCGPAGATGAPSEGPAEPGKFQVTPSPRPAALPALPALTPPSRGCERPGGTGMLHKGLWRDSRAGTSIWRSLCSERGTPGPYQCLRGIVRQRRSMAGAERVLGGGTGSGR